MNVPPIDKRQFIISTSDPSGNPTRARNQVNMKTSVPVNREQRGGRRRKPMDSPEEDTNVTRLLVASGTNKIPMGGHHKKLTGTKLPSNKLSNKISPFSITRRRMM